MNNIRHLEIILKTVERCNINCSYCYFFNGLDQSYKKHPPYISKDTIHAVAQFLVQGCYELDIRSIRIDFHGGEPLMQKVADFNDMCQIFTNSLASMTELSFAVQTNAMLINEKWIELFDKYQITVGVSLDGTKKHNDLYRLDKKGKSTYDKTIAGIQLLNKHAELKPHLKPGILSVVNPAFSAKEIYYHFVNTLGVQNIDFLLPDLTLDAVNLMENFNAQDYGKFLCEIFAEWIKDDNPSIRIRILNSYMSLIAGGKTALHGLGSSNQHFVAFTIASNGDLSPDDTLRSANPNLMNLGLNIYKNSLTNFLSHPVLQFLTTAENSIPLDCEACKWVKMCCGGALINRYSDQDLFSNKSIMCEGLKMIYDQIHTYLRTNGVCP